jgi:ATP-dependent DNA helicase RecG
MENSTPQININRLQQALTVEAENGFSNLQGKQYYFADFLGLSLGESMPDQWEQPERDRAQTLATEYCHYAELPLSDRQHLVAETRKLLYTVRRREITESSPPPKKEKKPKTEALVDPKSRSLSLDLQLQYLEGVGPHVAARLERLELYTVEDVLHYYPRDHIDYARQIAIAHLNPGDTVTVIGKIQRYNCFTSPKNPNLTIVEIILRDHTAQIKLNRFWTGKRYSNKGWQEQQKRLYPQGATVAASGVVKQGKYGLTLEQFEIEVLEHSHDRIESDTIGRVVPIYPLTEGVSPELIRRVAIQCLPVAHKIADPVPDRLQQDYKLIGLAEAVAQVHYPEHSNKLDEAIARLSFDKYFYRRLVSLYRRQQQKAIHFIPQSNRIEQLEQMLPFKLTGAQQRAIADIRNDLQGDTPMNRLVQGDVGSGKTIVAVYALLTAIEAGYQTALMAPTEVLAEQHYHKIVDWFNQLHLPVELLTGSTRTAKRREILSQLATGELPLVIGTHALIQDSVDFNQLGLVVIDEQHRFGRDQRSRLLQKGEDPHVLIMTATPIPRTLYLTNSEIDVSIIDELPPGRKPIQTTLLRPSQRREAHELIRREIAKDHQVYVVLPLVEESEKMEDIKAAVVEREHLQNTVFPSFQVGLLHGKMTSAEKEEAISKFRDRTTQILVATTVVEVGVDIPNASVMMIEHAERFGLAQLHQLRGRVGRGAAQSYCLLMSSSKTEAAQERLKVLEQSQDGFFIAERDFQMRGKGKDEGTEQSGHTGFSIDDRLPDEAARQEIYQIAREAAERIIKKDPTLESFSQLKAEFDRHYQRLQGGAIFT